MTGATTAPTAMVLYHDSLPAVKPGGQAFFVPSITALVVFGHEDRTMPQLEVSLTPDTILSGPFWPGPVRVIRVTPVGTSRVRVETLSLDGEHFVTKVLKLTDLARAQILRTVGAASLDGDAPGFRLAAEATRIRLAYTYDPQFAVSVSRIDALPHQLEAVYHYMLRQPRLRFLLADDPGAGKTVMAGLLLKELKLRGAVTRTLIVAPANLTRQWQREMADRFGEPFDLIDRPALNARDSRAWELTDQCVTSIDFAWRADVLESLARARRWDLVIVDEAHKMAAYRRGSKLERTRRYRLGEFLTDHTTHLLFLTATPHKGDPENFRLLLQLLDPDLFADTEILARAVQRRENPVFLRRLKEDMRGFDGKPLFPPRYVQTPGVELTPPEQALYERVTEYVVEHFGRALAEDNRNVTFALIILQRRLASSVRAIRRSLKNRHDRLVELRDQVRADPQWLEAARRGDAPPEEPAEDALEEERWAAEERALRYTVARNLDELEAEIVELADLAAQAQAVEMAGPERKLTELRRVVEEIDLFRSGEKLLIFTEAKDTLDYLVANLAAWGLSVTHIDGSMAPPDRYRAEREFEADKQVMVATEAAGEGINLQFCHLMINYDLPWNPTRLEQRMGRIHRYGQEYEVYIYNLVATSTREGMVLHALLKKLERMREGLGQDRVFDVVDQLLEGFSLEQLMREALARRLTFEQVRDRMLAQLDATQQGRLEQAALTGLATRYVDLEQLGADRRRAAEARLVPAYIRAFFEQAMARLAPGRLERRDDGFWSLPYVPAALRDVPEDLRRRYGAPAESYPALTFEQADLKAHRHLTWVGPGHPLFEAVVHHVLARFGPDLARGAVLRDPARRMNGLLWLVEGRVEDGLGRVAGRQLFALYQPLGEDGALHHVSPAALLDLEPPAEPLPAPENHRTLLSWHDAVIEWSLDEVLEPYLAGLQARRGREMAVVRDYLRRSFDVLIARSQGKLIEYEQRALAGADMSLSIQEEQRHLDDLRRRQATRLAETERAAILSLGAPEVLGVAAVVPAPEVPLAGPGDERTAGVAMRRSDPVETAAMAHAQTYEQARGWQVEDVHELNLGYDLRSLGPDGAVRYVEVKGRAGVGAVELSENEWLKAEQLGEEYWLYIVTDALSAPELYMLPNPRARLDPQTVVARVRYQVPTASWQPLAERASEYKV